MARHSRFTPSPAAATQPRKMSDWNTQIHEIWVSLLKNIKGKFIILWKLVLSLSVNSAQLWKLNSTSCSEIITVMISELRSYLANYQSYLHKNASSIYLHLQILKLTWNANWLLMHIVCRAAKRLIAFKTKVYIYILQVHLNKLECRGKVHLFQ